MKCVCRPQKEQQQQLQEALAGLPQPKNDYEIVIPEDEQQTQDQPHNGDLIEDQADLDSQAAALLAAEGWLDTHFMVRLHIFFVLIVLVRYTFGCIRLSCLSEGPSQNIDVRYYCHSQFIRVHFDHSSQGCAL